MKILIISHNPVSTQSNMGKTLLSLFAGFEKQELCQLYIYPAFPDRDCCSSYYRVTDKEVLRCLLSGKKPGGEIDRREISERQGLYENAEDQALYKNKKNKSALRRLMRDAMWAIAPWYNATLKDWLDREKPDCIFVAPGVAKFVYDFALKISGNLRIPIVSYICDEYYFVREPGQLLDKLRLKLLRAKIEALVGSSQRLIVISEELKKIYSKRFGTKTEVMLTGASGRIAREVRIPEEPKIIGYFGNIRCNRYISLCDVGQELEHINRTYEKNYRLRIYTAEKDPQILGLLADIPSVELCGFVAGEAYTEAMQNVDLLLHVEAFDEKSMDFTQHSVSTKIADSLASGIPLLAYAPESISSMQHLLRNACAITAVSKEALAPALRKALEDDDARKQAARNALVAAAAFHDSEKVGRKLRQILEEVVSAV